MSGIVIKLRKQYCSITSSAREYISITEAAQLHRGEITACQVCVFEKPRLSLSILNVGKHCFELSEGSWRMAFLMWKKAALVATEIQNWH